MIVEVLVNSVPFRSHSCVLEERVNHDSALSRQRAEADMKKRHAADSSFPYPELSISLSAVTNTLLNRKVAYTFCGPEHRANLTISEYLQPIYSS
jgi:hypothetical protein